MNLALSQQAEKILKDQMQSGRFASPEAVIEAALADFEAFESAALDDETVAAIQEGIDQADRGDGVELGEFRKTFFRSRGQN